MKNADPVVTVKQNDEAPVAVEILAESIVQIANGMRRINASRLTRGALVVLLKDATGLAKHQIITVLNALDRLEAVYCKPKKASR
jgi:hypothetical protein